MMGVCVWVCVCVFVCVCVLVCVRTLPTGVKRQLEGSSVLRHVPATIYRCNDPTNCRSRLRQRCSIAASCPVKSRLPLWGEGVILL